MAGPNYDLHRHLRAWRKYIGLTQEQVATKLQQATSTIAGWELGDRTVDLDDLKRLADIYKVSPALLLLAPPGTHKLKALDELSELMENMDAEAIDDLIRVAKRMGRTPPA